MAPRVVSLDTLLPLSPPMSDVELPLSEFFKGRAQPAEHSPPDTPDAGKQRKAKSTASRRKHAPSQLSSSSSARSPMDADWPNRARTDRLRDEPDSPILPRVRLPFPAIMSDDDDEDVWPRVSSHTLSSSSNASKDRSVSHATRTTTTTHTLRKIPAERTSRRHAKHSFHGSVDPENEPIPFGLSSAGPSRPSSPRLHRVSQRSHASTSHLNRGRPHSTSSVTASSCAPEDVTSASHRRKTSRASAFHVPANRSLDKQHNTRELLSRPQSKAFDAEAFSRALSNGSHQLMKPLITAFAVLFISTLACCSVFAVLASSYSLSMLDDCTERFAQLQKGIDQGQRRIRGSVMGVKDGMGKMVGSATRALDLVVWASGAKRIYVTKTPGASADDSSTDSSFTDEEFDARTGSARDTKPRPPVRRGRSNKTKPTVNSDPPAPEDLFHDSERRGQRDCETWTDDEQPPFDVPPTTPFGSRSASPHRPSLPPRPPLRVLIPSILFASLFVAVKLVRLLWTRQPSYPWRTYARKRSFQHL
ncbi:hypothetical protein OIV83_002231 [Microbotryomycetes sp. JL201]|nr:hypothetical protein OIV83_002231 [Microbotryomycetes sp. JL201]